MARIIQPAPAQEARSDWTATGSDFVTLVLDVNEAIALRNLTRDAHRRTVEAPHPMPSTSLSAAGARVFVVLEKATGGRV